MAKDRRNTSENRPKKNNKKGKPQENRKKPSIRQRSTILMAICLIVGFGLIIGRIAYLQFGIGEYLTSRAVSQQFSDIEVSAKRGTIYDTNNNVLAQSASVWTLAADPSEFETTEQIEYTAKGIAEILDMDVDKVTARLSQENSKYAVIKNQIESDVRDKILEFIENGYRTENDEHGEPQKIVLVPSTGLNFFDDYKRYYPYGSLASSVIGFTGADDQGLWGLEYEYNELLTGTPGRLVAAQNANGGTLPFEYKQNIEAQDGKNLVLTIDQNIQSIVEKYMEQAIIENRVFNRAGCIMMNPQTGEIIANATVGGFDLNDPYTLDATSQAKLDATPEEKKDEKYSELLYEMWRNKTVSDTYYPGSVFKMITASMALEEGVVDDNSRFYCNGVMSVYDQNIHCHELAGHGTQTFTEAIWNSCNPALIQIGQLIGETNFWKYYQAFGFDRRTGVDLPGEAEDIFFTEDGSMGPVDLAVAAFGQNFSITPMQMITAASAVANGGYLVQPHLVKEVLDQDNNVVSVTSDTVKRQVISAEVSAQMCEILEGNAIYGGAKNAYIAGYRVAGKTGTSEKKVDLNGDGKGDYISSFCGFAPADNAQVVMLIFFDTPLGDEYYGSKVAAPVFAQIMSEVLPYLEIETQYTDEELENIDTKAGSYIGLELEAAKTAVTNDGFTAVVRGEGTTVLSQVPEASSTIPTGGTVVLYTDEESQSDTVTVPDLLNISLETANARAAEYGVNISVAGTFTAENSTSSKQSIPYGTQVAPGTVITVTFESTGFND